MQPNEIGQQRVKAVVEWGRTPPAGRGPQSLLKVGGTGPSSRLVGRVLVDGEFVHPSWLIKRVRQKKVHSVHLKHLVWSYHDFGFGNSLAHVGRETVRWWLKTGVPTAIRPWNSQPIAGFPYADDEMLKESAVVVMDRYPVPNEVVSNLLKDAPFVAGYYMLEGTRVATYVLDRLEGYDAILTPSAFCKKALEESGLTTPIFVWGHGFDHEVFPYTEPKPNRPFTFLWFGDENRRKGYDLFLEAFRRLQVPNVRAWVRRPGSGGIAGVSENYKNDPRIVWDTRVTPPEQLKELYAEVDVIVCPYRGEGFCLPMLEAMGAGRAAIATKWSGPLDFGSDETTYWLDPKYPEPAQNDDGIQMAPAIEQIVERMKWCAEHPEEVRQKGLKAAQIAHEKWRWEKKVLEVIPPLRSLIPHLEIAPR